MIKGGHTTPAKRRHRTSQSWRVLAHFDSHVTDRVPRNKTGLREANDARSWRSVGQLTLLTAATGITINFTFEHERT